MNMYQIPNLRGLTLNPDPGDEVYGKVPTSCEPQEVDDGHVPGTEREFFIDNLLVRIHFIIVMIR